MILETIGTTLLGEWIRSKLPKKRIKNNRMAIETITEEMPTFQTVGELRALLENFADDVPTHNNLDFPLMQVRVIDGKGLISFGRSSAPKRSKVQSLKQYHETHPPKPVRFYSWPRHEHEMLSDGTVRTIR